MNYLWLTRLITSKSAEEVKRHMKTIETFLNAKEQTAHTIAEIKTFLRSFIMLTSNVQEEGIEIITSGGAALVTLEDVERLICAVVALYLRQWFTNSNNPRSTIYEFINSGYMHKSDMHYFGKQKNIDTAQRKALEAAMKKHQSFLNLRRIQILQNPDISFDAESGKRRYDYVSLTWIEQYCEGYLGYIDLIFMRKQIMRRTQNKELYEPLAEVCGRYHEGLKKISALYSKIETTYGKDRVALCREYVASCMLVAWLESGLNFHRACRIAEHLTRAYPGQPEPNEIAMNCFWRSFEAANETSEIIRGYRKEGAHQVNYAWDILNYEEEITCVYTEPAIEGERKCVSYRVLREKFLELWSLLYSYRPLEKQPQWTPELYQEAADFFHNEYPVVERYATIEFPAVESVFLPLEEGQTRRRRKTLENNFYQHLEKIFLAIMDMDNSQLDFARQYFLEAKGKRN